MPDVLSKFVARPVAVAERLYSSRERKTLCGYLVELVFHNPRIGEAFALRIVALEVQDVASVAVFCPDVFHHAEDGDGLVNDVRHRETLAGEVIVVFLHRAVLYEVCKRVHSAIL